MTKKTWSKNKLAAVVAGGLLAAAAVGVGVASYASPWVAFAKVRAAVEAKDEKALSAAVDWQSVRDENIRRVASQALAASGLLPGDERVDEVVMGVQNAIDEMATPKNLIKAAGEGKLAPELLRVEGAYLNVGVFIFAVENKKTKSAVMVRLRRQGPMSWRIDDVIPLNASEAGGK